MLSGLTVTVRAQRRRRREGKYTEEPSRRFMSFGYPEMPSGLNLRLVLVVGLCFSSSLSLHLEMESGHTKCIAEDIKTDSMTVGKYSIVNPHEGLPLPESHRVAVRVTSSYGNNHHYEDGVESGQFAFTATDGGEYMTCFFAPEYKPQVKFSVDFDWRTGVAAKDWSGVAKKGSVDVMEVELKKLFDTVTSIHEEMFYLREREAEMQQLNKTTISKMVWMGFLSLLICLSVAALQLWHLKTFFEKRKLI